MSLILYGHPFSSFTEKVLIALYENETPFTFRSFGPDDPAAAIESEALWPLKRFPVLVDGDRMIAETSIIIEHVTLTRPGAVRLIPEDPVAALEVRFMDRVFDNYVMSPMLRLAFDASRPEGQRDSIGASEARATLDAAYRWLDERMARRIWAAGDDFSLADCAAAPALLFAHWAHPIAEIFGCLHGFRRRLLARPSFRRVVDEARPFRRAFPLGAPEHDD